MNLRSGYPFWLIKNGLPYNYPKLASSCSIDVVVLGGGISGALSAYYLNEANIQCMVVDARTIGLGSTCASTSLLQYEIDTSLTELTEKIGLKKAEYAYQQCAESISELLSIAKKIKFAECKPKKSLYYASYKKDVPFLKKEFTARKNQGFNVTYLESNELRSTFGFDAPGAILSACGAEINAYSFTHALLQFAIKKGTEVYDRTPIVKVNHHKKGVTLHTADGHTIKAKKIVYATGYEVTEFIDKKIVDLNSTYVTISEQANEKAPYWNDDVLIWNTADPYLYMRTTADNRILVGGRDETFSNAAKRDQLIDTKKKQLVKDFNHIFPDIEFLPEFSWAGTFGSTVDGLPFIGSYSKLPNSYFALGFGGNGITFSVIAAKMICSLIKGYPKNAMDNIYSFERI
jgi:glycine/D-amino acid oxidase-like deaminating enzyme